MKQLDLATEQEIMFLSDLYERRKTSYIEHCDKLQELQKQVDQQKTLVDAVFDLMHETGEELRAAIKAQDS